LSGVLARFGFEKVEFELKLVGFGQVFSGATKANQT
jgi:hypothetical protein